MLDLAASENLSVGENFALGVAVGLAIDMPRIGRAFALTDAEAKRLRERIKAHYRKHGAGSTRLRRMSRAS